MSPCEGWATSCGPGLPEAACRTQPAGQAAQHGVAGETSVGVAVQGTTSHSSRSGNSLLVLWTPRRLDGSLLIVAQASRLCGTGETPVLRSEWPSTCPIH